ncbi:hypothetical protein AB1N83_006291 [Pleurotus pulmonarius]
MPELSDPIDIEVLQGLKIITYIVASSIAFLIYDYLLTIPSEIQYVWRANWGTGKALYLLSRYPMLVVAPLRIQLTFSHVIFGTECHALYLIAGHTMTFTVIISETVRIWALWHRSIWLAVIFAFMTVIGVVAVLFSIRTSAHDVTFVSDHPIVSLSYPACMAVGQDRTTSIISLVLLIGNGTGVFLLMDVVAAKSRAKGIPFSSMMYTFYKDGVVYFTALLALSIVNLIVSLTQPPQFSNPLLSTQSALHSVLSTRMLLNLRQSAHRDFISVNSILNPDISSQRYLMNVGY